MSVAPEDWDPRSRHVLNNQIAAYDAMRERCPVAHSEHLGWSVFRHADVVAVVTDHETFSSEVSRYPAVPNGFDPPRHAPYRRLIDRYFTPAHMAAFEPVCRALARDLVARIPREQEFEFIAQFALEYALQAQRAWLGWPEYTVDALRHWTARNHRATLRREREELDAVAAEFDATVRRVLADERALLDQGTLADNRQAADAAAGVGGNAGTGTGAGICAGSVTGAGAGAGTGTGAGPGTRSGTAASVTLQLLGDSVDGIPLTDEDIVSILRNWTVGELGTMSASVGILVAYLAEHPDLQGELRGSPAQLDAAIDEILRMHSPLIANRRVATREVMLGGRTIKAGERVNVNWASANRDEAVFGDPDEYQPQRNAADNVLYGRGIHVCPGAPLARLELRVIMEELLAATASIGIAPGAGRGAASRASTGSGTGAPASGNRKHDLAVFPASGYRTLPIVIR